MKKLLILIILLIVIGCSREYTGGVLDKIEKQDKYGNIEYYLIVEYRGGIKKLQVYRYFYNMHKIGDHVYWKE